MQNKLIFSKDKSINILKKYKFNYVLFNGTLHHLSDPFATIKKLLNFHETNFKSKNFYVIGIEPTNTILRVFGEFVILKTFIGDIFFKDLKNYLIKE